MPTLEQIRLQLEHSLADLRMMEIAQRPAEKWEKEKAAFARGETIQWRSSYGGEWEDCDRGNEAPLWLSPLEYRIKPAPAWQPRFKVGDRVKIKQDKRHFSRIYDGEQKVIEVMSERARYRLSCSDYTTWPEDALELIPWPLSRHLPGFRALTDGEEWHRNDFTEEMLKGGWRPLLKGEMPVVSDNWLGLRCDSNWIIQTSTDYAPELDRRHLHHRTRRPLPALPTERVALTFEEWWDSADHALAWGRHGKEVALAAWQAASTRAE